MASLEFIILVYCAFQLVKSIPAAICNLFQVCLLFVIEFAVREDDFDIEENN
jgi:hypothetical protein